MGEGISVVREVFLEEVVVSVGPKGWVGVHIFQEWLTRFENCFAGTLGTMWSKRWVVWPDTRGPCPSLVGSAGKWIIPKTCPQKLWGNQETKLCFPLVMWLWVVSLHCSGPHFSMSQEDSWIRYHLGSLGCQCSVAETAPTQLPCACITFLFTERVPIWLSTVWRNETGLPFSAPSTLKAADSY